MLGLVCEHWGSGDVADGVDAGDVGLAVAVDHDTAAVGFDAELFEAEILDVADHADRRDHTLELGRDRLALAVVDRGDDAVGLLLEFRHLGRGQDLDSLLLEALAGEAGNLGVPTGRICGNTSTTVTSEPMVWKNEANSMPIAPEPTTSSDFGIRSGTIASK